MAKTITASTQYTGSDGAQTDIHLYVNEPDTDYTGPVTVQIDTNERGDGSDDVQVDINTWGTPAIMAGELFDVLGDLLHDLRVEAVR